MSQWWLLVLISPQDGATSQYCLRVVCCAHEFSLYSCSKMLHLCWPNSISTSFLKSSTFYTVVGFFYFQKKIKSLRPYHLLFTLEFLFLSALLSVCLLSDGSDNWTVFHFTSVHHKWAQAQKKRHYFWNLFICLHSLSFHGRVLTFVDGAISLFAEKEKQKWSWARA